LIDALLLRPLPVSNPERLFSVTFEGPAGDGRIANYDSCSYPMFERMRAAIAGNAEAIAVSYAERIDLTYSRDEEMEVLKRTTGAAATHVQRVLTAEQIVQLQDIVRRVPVGDHVYNYALDIVRATRPNDPAASDFVRHWLSWGAGPRAGQYLILAGKARALMLGRLHVTLEDIAAVASPVLRHRIVPNFNAEAEGIVVEQIIDKLLTIVPRGSGERLL